MGKHSRGLVLLIILFLFSGTASAAAPSAGRLWFLSAEIGISSGSLVGEDLGFASRSMVVYGLGTDFGVRLGGFMIGVGAGYDLWKQLKKPADLADTNAQGAEFSWGPLLGYDFGKFTLLGRYSSSSKYSLDKEDVSGNKVSFSKPKSSFSVECRIPFGSGTPYVGLEYKSMKYGRVDMGGTSTDISSGSELKTSSVGLSLGMNF